MDHRAKELSESEIGIQAGKESLVAIYLDDEPLDHILYGEGDGRSTLANLYLAGTIATRKLADACCQRDWSGINKLAEQLCGMGKNISKFQLHAIAAAISAIVPNCPKPLTVRFEASHVVKLLELVWEFSLTNDDVNIKSLAGPSLARLYEYLRRYDEAYEVNNRLLQDCRQTGSRREEASMLNNLGFTLLLHERWSEAAPYFEKAASLYKELGVNLNHANAICNYWHCRIELGEWGNIEETSSILKNLAGILRGSAGWYERKPLVLIARLEEHSGNHRKAIPLVVKAIRSAGLSGTTYPEEDRRYLKKLWSMKSTHRSSR